MYAKEKILRSGRIRKGDKKRFGEMESIKQDTSVVKGGKKKLPDTFAFP